MDKAMQPTGYQWDGDQLTVAYEDGVSFRVIDPQRDRAGHLWAEVIAAIGDNTIHHARIDLLSQRDLVDFRAIAHERDGRVAWTALLIPLVEPAQQRPDGGTQGTEAEIKDRWPKLDKSKALLGLAGQLTAAIDQYTEADPVAVLLNILTAFGNIVGPKPHFLVEQTRHALKLFVAQVGETAKGRKGTGWSTPRYVFASVDEAWARDHVTAGLSSGEGLIYAVRDERWEKQPIREKGRVVDYQRVLVDEGVSDKRLLLVEEEFAQALKVMGREGNILSPTLRQAWDTGHLRPLTKNNPIRATDAHVSIIAHITKAELLRHLDSTEQTNGGANRFLWAMVRRSKTIANPTGTPASVLNPLIQKLQKSIERAKQIGRMQRDSEAEVLWHEWYTGLVDQPGLFGAITARAEVQVMRLAAIYAAIDGTEMIHPQYLEAGMAVWHYCEASARYIFGDSTGDPVADRIIAGLQAKGAMTRTSISKLFDRNMPAEKIEGALGRLVGWGRVMETEDRGEGRGRPSRVIQLVEP